LQEKPSINQVSFGKSRLTRAAPPFQRTTGRALRDEARVQQSTSRPRGHALPLCAPPPSLSLSLSPALRTSSRRDELASSSVRSGATARVASFHGGAESTTHLRAWRQLRRRSLPHTGWPLPGGSFPPAVGRERSARLRQVHHPRGCAQGGLHSRYAHLLQARRVGVQRRA
jgi:hypothetical protein